MRKVLICFAFILGSAAQAEEVVIAALGDSLTQGYGLPAEEGFVPQLQDWLDAEGVEAKILNAGVSGDTTAGGLARVDWTLTPEVDAMIVTLGGNDMLRGLDPAQARGNIDGILAAAEKAEVEVLLVGMSAPGNYGAGYKADFEGLYPDLAEAYGTLFYPDFFTGLLAEEKNAASARSETVQRYLQGDGIHPNAEGVALIVEDIGPAVAELAARAAERR
ncbi:arylesterase [Sulfitobacter sp. KE29]|uniref:arylesterase n=1 Tax=unclassified Sulfitobacter TaxID=196795 RepID=UPI0007C26339|nr:MULTISPECIES: arylesterase [unclassified Sulfitobacter]KZY51451.1 arylesterase [Sulfitobacter sp. HI0054]MBO9439948.1 arylesterase [Sulfitobacter sp. R18_2]MDF3419905.1 arylesterase [Sulfitobacter sp. Ks38]MDF3427388.1 arylesterase [Sulfitobacter sp. KE29]MDF3430969.1 arylesterase [Sulfitobacter sp. S46]